MAISRKLVIFVVAGAVGVGLWYGLKPQPNRAVSVLPAATGTLASRGLEHAPLVAQAPRAPNTAAPQSPKRSGNSSGYAQAFREAKNYKEFILATLPAARKGDADAQYYLYAAIAHCDETNRFFFRRGNRTLGIDEAITERERLPGPSMTSAIRRADSQCHDVNNSTNPEWGTAGEWLAKATVAGQPAAQVRTAGNVVIASMTAGPPGKADPSGEVTTVSDALSLLRTAIESNDPEAIFQAGDYVGLLKSPEQRRNNPVGQALIWEYAACLRGMDCAGDSNWHVAVCLTDPGCRAGETGTDYLIRNARDLNIADLEARARSLNSALDAGSWEQLNSGD